MYVFRFFAASVLCLFFTNAHAADYVPSHGKLSDDIFYRLVACGAPPGKNCQKTYLHWPKPEIKIAIVDAANTLSADRVSIARQSLRHAIDQVNNVGSSIKLVQSSAQTANIKIYLSSGNSINRHYKVSDIRRSLGWGAHGVARVFYENGKIYDAIIVVAAESRNLTLKSVMLEEIVQSLGLTTDIKNRYYRRHSIFSEKGNVTTELIGQDAQALRMHYLKH